MPGSRDRRRRESRNSEARACSFGRCLQLRRSNPSNTMCTGAQALVTLSMHRINSSIPHSVSKRKPVRALPAVARNLSRASTISEARDPLKSAPLSSNCHSSANRVCVTGHCVGAVGASTDTRRTLFVMRWLSFSRNKVDTVVFPAPGFGYQSQCGAYDSPKSIPGRPCIQNKPSS